MKIIFVLDKKNKTLTFNGKTYRALTDYKIKCLDALNIDRRKGGRGLHEDNLVELAGKIRGERINNIFKPMKKWKDVIKKVGTKTYSLNIPRPKLKKSVSKKPLVIFQTYIKRMILIAKNLSKNIQTVVNTKTLFIEGSTSENTIHYRRDAQGPYLPPPSDYTEPKPFNLKQRNKIIMLHSNWQEKWLGALGFALRENINQTYSFLLGSNAGEVIAQTQYGDGKKAVEIEISFLEKILSTRNKTTYLSNAFIQNPGQINEYR